MNKGRHLLPLLIVLLSAVIGVPVSAQEFKLEPKKYVVPVFSLQSGATIENMVVEYVTLGEPRRSPNGEIVNAVLSLHGSGGNHNQTLTNAKDLFGPGKPLDPVRYLIIFPTALGNPGSSSPSTSGLGAKFPKYSIADQVAAQHSLVTKHLGIKHLAGVIGSSMGGVHTLQWITQYPDMMTWAIPIAAGAMHAGRLLAASALTKHMVAMDPTYLEGRYTEPPREAMRRALMGVSLWNFGTEFYQQFKTQAAAMKWIESVATNADRIDANDFVWSNNASFGSLQIADSLAGVKARVLLIGVEEDEIVPVKQVVVPTAKLIPGAQLFVYSSALGHRGGSVEIGKATGAIEAFLTAAEKH